MRAALGVLDSGIAAALVLYGFPPTASIGAVLAYEAVSIWVPGCGGIIAVLFSRSRPLADEPSLAPPVL